MTVLISAAELQQALRGPVPPRVLDASFELAAPQAGRRTFEAAHVPGAAYVHLDEDLCGTKTGLNGRHPLPALAAFAQTLGALGLNPEQDVVVMDRGNSMFAARLWWMLRWAGHARVRVLDGGWSAWADISGASESGAGRARLPQAQPYPAALDASMPSVDADTLQARLQQVRLIDARAPERFRGDVEPLDPVAGHIPGAINLPFTANLDASGRFLPAAALQARWHAVVGEDPAGVVHQCGSGVTACHNLLATMVAGYAPGGLYPGSWSEWCADPRRPVARGDGPS